MQWWNELVDWINSSEGWRVLSSVVFPFLAIVVAGFVAAMIGRGSTKRLITHHDREQRVSTVAALIGAARRASKWNTLSLPEQQHADHLAHDADISTRLLPLVGSTMTADWAAHAIADMKKNSVSFSFQAEQSLMDFRDRLVTWQGRPSRAKKLFKADLDLWAYESTQEDKGLVEKQQEWAKQQVAAETGPISTVQATATHSSTHPISPAASNSAAPAPAAAPAAESSTVPSTVPAPDLEPAFDSSLTPTSDVATASHEVTTDATPSPVSAQTVRQRINPDEPVHDGPR